MKRAPRLLRIASLGLAAVAVAMIYRGHVLRARRPAAIARSAVLLAVPTVPDAPAPAAQEAALRAAAAAHPTDHHARWELVNFYMQGGRAGKAAAQLDAITRLGSRSGMESLALANVRLQLKQYPQAEAMYRKTISRLPKDREAWQGLAAVLFRQQRFLEAMETARRAVQLAPRDPGGHLVLASSALAYGTQFGDSRTHRDALVSAYTEFQDLTSILPDSAEVYFQLGRVDVLLQHLQEAIAALQRSVALTPTPMGYQQLALAEKDSSEAEAARRSVEEGLAHFPEDAALHDLRGQLLQEDAAPGVAGQALAEFQTAVRLAPGREKFHEREGVALLAAGRLPEARAAFGEAVRLDPNQVFPYQQLALVYTRLGNVPLAKTAETLADSMAFNNQQLRQIQALTLVHPDSVPLRLVLADRYRDLKMTAAARDEYLLVQHLNPGNTHARRGLAALTRAPS